MLHGFTINSFRNFGDEAQWVYPLRRVNIFVGTNNSGKSNVLRYIKRVISPAIDPSRNSAIEQLQIDRPTGGGMVSQVKFWQSFPPKNIDAWDPSWVVAFDALGLLNEAKDLICLQISTSAISAGNYYNGEAPEADVTVQRIFNHIWQTALNRSGGGFEQHWFREVMNRITQGARTSTDCYYVPSFRHIPTRMAEFADEFSNAGDDDHIIDRLAGLAYPSYTEQHKKDDFEKLRRFVGLIINDANVKIEIPNDRKTVNVRTGNSFLPIESLGSGIHEVFILASEIVSRPSQTILLEEPESHLHPTLQRRFMQFLMDETSNQIFITTHSATVIDTPGASLFEIRSNSQANIRPITTGQERFAACRELGFRASDLIQTNSVVWVEGPSDRIYLKA